MLRLVAIAIAAAVAEGILAAAALQSTGCHVEALSIPSPATHGYEDRAKAISAASTTIQNGPRTHTVNRTVLPFYVGPEVYPGSFAEKMRLEEAKKIQSHRNELPKLLMDLVSTQNLTSLGAISALYHEARQFIEMPMSMDPSDTVFGHQRLTIKPMKLRQVREEEFQDVPFGLTDADLAKRCGEDVTWASIRHLKSLYVEDFRGLARWNARNRVNYVPDVMGFFCYNDDTGLLVPVEIRFPGTRLHYTPLDHPDEWTLAKMGLEAASITYHQLMHMAEIHGVTIPLRTELYRTMAPEHPVRALLEHHFSLNFGLELLVGKVLLSSGTGLDQMVGWGAEGSTRFISEQIETVIRQSRLSLESDLSERGVGDIPTNAYVHHSRLLHRAIRAFVQSFVAAYYADDATVARDPELQGWWRACATNVPQVQRAFAGQIHTRSQLTTVLTDSIFRSSVQHHAMNGEVTWHSMAPPYSPISLWKPLPSAKLRPGESLNLLDYTIPSSRLGVLFALSATFFRPPPANETWLQAYRHEPFQSEPRLDEAIAAFETELERIDALIHRQAQAMPFPFETLRPGRLPFSSWV